MFTFDLGSSSRRKSSATSLPPPLTMKRLRSPGRISDLEPFVESAESPPDKKRLREDSEPAEEEDPGILSTVLSFYA